MNKLTISVFKRYKINMREVSVKQTEQGTQISISVFTEDKKLLVMAIDEITVLRGISNSVFSVLDD